MDSNPSTPREPNPTAEPDRSLEVTIEEVRELIRTISLEACSLDQLRAALKRQRKS